MPKKARQKSGQGPHAWAPWLSPDVDLWASNFSCTQWGGACALLAILKMICVSDAWTLKHCVSLVCHLASSKSALVGLFLNLIFVDYTRLDALISIPLVLLLRSLMVSVKHRVMYVKCLYC